MGLIKRILGLEAAKIKAAIKGKPERRDMDLPLGIFIGSTVNFNPATFIIGGDELVFKAPKGRCLCKGYSRLRYAETDYVRFYLEDEADGDYILQVGMDKGDPAEFILYQPFVDPFFCPDGEICPADQEEWRDWIGRKGYIGCQCFNIPNGTQYDRVIMPEKAKRIAPFDYIESGAFDPFEPPEKLADISGMTYGRTISVDDVDVLEFALPEKREDGGGAFIAVLIGVEVSKDEISTL